MSVLSVSVIGGGSATSRHRAHDSLTRLVGPDGDLTDYEYDLSACHAQAGELDRLTKEKWTAVDNTVLHDFAYVYDDNGNLTRVLGPERNLPIQVW